MTAVLEQPHAFVERFDQEPPHARPWINALRQHGMDTFGRLGFPSTRLEEWRDTNVAPLTQMRFTASPMAAPAKVRALLERHSFGTAAAAELVFVNGRFDAGLSNLPIWPKGVRAMSMAQAIEHYEALVERHLAHYPKIEEHPFAALNTGFIREGA